MKISPQIPAITRVRSDRQIAKRFTRDPETGVLKKKVGKSLASGDFFVEDVPDAAALADLVGRLVAEDVLILGRPKGGLRRGLLKTKDRVEELGATYCEANNIIGRAETAFEFSRGPGWIVIDHDTDKMPQDVRDRVEALGGVLGALASIWPEIEDAARVHKASSSGGVYVDGGSPSIATGSHTFVLVEDVSRTKEALKALQARAWMAGLAYWWPNAVGVPLERSIVDVSVSDTNRVIFTAPPILGPGVRRDPPPVQFWEGRAVPVPTAPSAADWEPIRDAARAAIEPQAIRVIARRRNITEDAARELVRNPAEREDLSGDVQIFDREGRLTTVRAFVAGLTRPCRFSMPDPFEGPDYGWTTATLFWEGGHPAPIIKSHAHGLGKVYRLPAPDNGRTPAHEIWKVKLDKLKNRREATLSDALKGVRNVSQIGTVLAVAAALANRTPHQMSLEDVTAFLIENLPDRAIPADWVEATMIRVRWTQEKRRLRAMAPVTISAAAREGVEVVKVKSLSALKRLDGITIVRAPMASGKTQKVARPWVEMARAHTEARAQGRLERAAILAGSAVGMDMQVKDDTLTPEEWDQIAAERNARAADKARREGRVTPPPLTGAELARKDAENRARNRERIENILETKGQGDPSGVWAICHRVTLVEELAQRLDLTSYRAGAPELEKLAICLPSITLDPFARAYPDYLFIDEIQQVLRFLRSQECCRTAKARTPDKVFDRLVEVVKRAKGVLVADAGADDAVIQFLRYCRPNDPIRLVEMAEPEDAGIEAVFLSGEKGVYGAAVDRAAEDLHKGEKLWIATEGAEAAQKIGTFLKDATKAANTPPKVLIITAKNKGGDAQAAFLRDPETESRRWDCVIASPVISSGISIEHRGAAHFSRGFYFGTGQALTPADAAQQLRRVRYLRRFVIALAQNNSTGGRSVEQILSGREAAARDEGRALQAGAFDHLIACFEAQEADAKADFGAGLWWQLQAAGWTLTRASVTDGVAADALTLIGRERAEKRTRAIVAASHDLEHLTQDDIDALQRAGEKAATVEAWQMTRALGVPFLSAEDVAFVDGGGLKKLNRFDDLAGLASITLDDQDRETALVHRNLRIARAKHYREIFGDHDPLSPEPWLTREIAEQILDRVMGRADAYAASGAIPRKYAAKFGRPAPARPRDAVKAVRSILARAGLGMTGIQVRVSQIPPNCVTESGGICDKTKDKPPSGRSARERRYCVRPEDVEAMERRSATRRAAQLDSSHPAHIEAVKRLFDRLDSRSDPIEVEIQHVETDEIDNVWGRELVSRLGFSRVSRAAIFISEPELVSRDSLAPP